MKFYFRSKISEPIEMYSAKDEFKSAFLCNVKYVATFYSDVTDIN